MRRRQQFLDRALEGLTFHGGRVQIAEDASSAFQDPPNDPWWLFAQGRSMEAVEAARKRVVARPEADELLLLGQCLARVEVPEKALAAFLTALDAWGDGTGPSIAAGRVEAQLEAAAALLRLGHDEDAAQHFRDVLSVVPREPRAHAGLARLYMLQGRRDLAEPHWKIAQAQGTGLPTILPSLVTTGALPAMEIRSARVGRDLNLGPAVRVDAGTQGANETSVIATNGAVPRLIAGWNDDREAESSLAIALSEDGGTTWSDQLFDVPDEVKTDVGGDPMTAFDPRTGDLWVGGISFAFGSPSAITVARWPAGAADLDETAVAHVDTSFIDKGWMAAGPAPGDPASTRVYLAYNLGVQTSADQGASWTPPNSLGPYVGPLPRVGTQGELYILARSTGDPVNVVLLRSFDGATTFEEPIVVATLMHSGLNDVVPGQFRIAFFPVMAVDPTDGRLLVVYEDHVGEGDVDLFLVTSTDGGVTWSPPAAYSGAGGGEGDQFMPWIEVDAQGGLHLLFYDTRNTSQDDTDVEAWLDAYYAYSYDDGASWIEARLTPQSFSSWDAQFGFFSQFLGDYLGMAVSGGMAYPMYPSTVDGTTDIFVRTVDFSAFVFGNGFESGDVSGWSSAVAGDP